MTLHVESIKQTLDDWLAQGFTSPEDYQSYQKLKENYEDETHDYSFSKREVIGQLELMMSTRENNFPQLEEGLREVFLDIVDQLDELDKGQADYYRRQLID